MRKEIALSIAISLAVSFEGAAQVFLRYSTTEQEAWKEGKTKLSAKPASQHTVDIVGQGQGHVFRAWGTCFNELDLDALRLLSDEA